MSQRTIIEINHDYSHTIARDPEVFLDALRSMLSSAGPRTYEPLKHFGITVVETVHHSTDRRVTIMGKEVWRG